MATIQKILLFSLQKIRYLAWSLKKCGFLKKMWARSDNCLGVIHPQIPPPPQTARPCPPQPIIAALII